MNEEKNEFENNSFGRGPEVEIPDIDDGMTPGITFAGKKWIYPVVVIAAVIVIGTLVWFLVLRDPLALKTAFSKLKSDAIELEDPVLSGVDSKLILNRYYEGRLDAEYSLNVSGIEQIPATIGLDGMMKRDAENRLMSAETSASVMNQKVAGVSIYADDYTLMFRIPELVDSSFVLQLDTIGEDWNSSLFSGLTALEIPADLKIDLFPQRKTSIWSDLVSGWKQNKSEILDELIGNVKVEERGKKCELTISDQETMICRRYRICLAKDAANHSLALLLGNQDVSVQDDLLLDVYCGQKGKLVRIASGEPIALSGLEASDIQNIEFDGNFYGEENSFDRVIAHLSVGDTTDTLEFSRGVNERERNYSVGLLKTSGSGLDYVQEYYCIAATTDEAEHSFSVDASLGQGADAMETSDYTVSVSGILKESNDSVLELQLDKLAMAGEGIPDYKITGHIRADLDAARGGDVITAYDSVDEAIDPFNMSIMDLIGIATDLASRYKNLSNTFNTLSDLGLF